MMRNGEGHPFARLQRSPAGQLRPSFWHTVILATPWDACAQAPVPT